MAEEETLTIAEAAPRRRFGWRRIAAWTGAVLGVIALALLGTVLWLNSDSGRQFVARQIGGIEMATGLNIRVGRINGSLYGAMILHDVEVRDPQGVFATAREIRMDWRPFAYLSNRVDVRSLSSPEVKIARLPAFKPGDPNAPILPDMGIDIARLEIARIDLAPAVAGRRHVASLSGSVHIADGRAQVMAKGGTIAGEGLAGGDRLDLRLDAAPDRDRFDIRLKLQAPAQGLVAGLAGLESPLAVSVDGAGSWQQWRGRAQAQLGGAQFADLAMEARNGRFTLRGPTHPGLYMKGPVERLASPQLDVDLAADWRDRRANTQFTLKSDALQVVGAGLVDLADNRFGNFRVEAMLLTPGSIAPNLTGESVRAAIALNGPFATPVVDYKLQAGRIGFDGTVVERLAAEGQARVNSDRILIPVRAKALRVSGLNQAAGGLTTNLTLDGDLAITGDQILSDNLRIRSDRIDATAIVAADMGDGRYTGALEGRVNDYRIAGVGVVNLTTDAELYAAPGGGWGIRGKIAGRSARIFNDGVREFLGGQAIASARLGLDPKGIVTFNTLRLSAPEFRITDGSGRYDPAGALLLNANAVSTQYGPMTARVTGTLNAPQVLLRASRPGLGVGLADLEANIRGRGNGYAVVAKGATDYGPFTANVLLSTGGALAIDIQSARFAGMDIEGRLQQSAAGPFAGQLDFAGSGVNGNARLSAQGKLQRADFDARASNARIPGTADLTIGRMLAKGWVVLDETPHVVADAQIANFRSGEFVLRTARARIDYRGGAGTAQLLANGSTGVPFRVVANAQFQPNEWLVALQGQASGVNFKTSRSARIAVRDDTYRLLPTQVDFDKGSARLAGSYGAGLNMQARLDKLDLAAVNAFLPGLGIGGSATGSLDFAQATPSSFPTADARIEVTGFTRSSLAAVSTPVNVTFVGKLLPNGGDARALIKRGSTTIGRMVATLSPLGPEAGSWQSRLFAAPLSGGIRYNGPSAVVFSLAGLADQQLSGPIGIAADFTGRVERPQFAGVVRASNLTYENETYGTRLTAMKLDGRFSMDQLIITELTATAGTGTVKGSGTIGLSSADNFPMNLTADLNDAQLARSDALGATATGRIAITHGLQGGKIEGRLDIPEARYQIIRQGAAEVADLSGVRRKSDVFRTPEQRAAAARAGLWELALRIRADNRLFVSGMGLESEWAATITVTGTSANPRIGGSANLVRGTYEFAGKRFIVTRGTIRFPDGNLTNPTIDLAATTTAEGVTAILNVTGSAQQPRIAFTSSPALPQEEVLSRLLFGNSVTDLSATEAIQLAAALNSLRGAGGGLNPLGSLRSAVGIDRLRILSEDQAGGHGTALAAGQYITDDIYVEVITDARGFTATQLEIALSRSLSVLSQTSSFGGSGVSLRYSRDY